MLSKPFASFLHTHDRAGMLMTLFSLFGAPGAWVIQITLSEILVSYACYPHHAPLPWPLWEHLTLMLAALNGFCLVVALAAGLVAWAAWRRAQVRPDAREAYFLGLLGLMASYVFGMAVIFTLCAFLLVSPCSPWF